MRSGGCTKIRNAPHIGYPRGERGPFPEDFLRVYEPIVDGDICEFLFKRQAAVVAGRLLYASAADVGR
jgi:hypothetical protein